MSWADKKVLVLGAGESGLSMARHLADAGALLRVADTRTEPPGAKVLLELGVEMETAWGPYTPELFDGIAAVAVSPGVPVSGPLADPLVLEAKLRGLPFVGDVELFALALETEKQATGYAPKVLAITGTNGKTTVTALTAFLANRAGKRAVAAGNISPAVLDAWRAARSAGELPDIWVLELSSYQLETTHSLHPDAAVMLNLSEDHLDRHGSLKAYADAKARIFAGGGLQILNRDDPASLAMRRPFVPKGKKDTPPVVVTFGTGEPQSEYEYGLTREARPGGLAWLAESTNRLMPVEVLKIKGVHNAMNALAALALNRSIGLPLAPMLKALKDYPGEAHRVQEVAQVAGVTYIDDSKGTNVGATLAALNGLGSEMREDRKIVLIAGGDGKGQNFAPLAQPVAAYCRAVMLIGRDAQALDDALRGTGVDLVNCASLPEAVAGAGHIAREGDLVLLSPACASLDMFRNYAHRAEVFVTAVREIGRAAQVAEVADSAEPAAAASDAGAGDLSAGEAANDAALTSPDAGGHAANDAVLSEVEDGKAGEAAPEAPAAVSPAADNDLPVADTADIAANDAAPGGTAPDADLAPADTLTADAVTAARSVPADAPSATEGAPTADPVLGDEIDPTPNRESDPAPGHEPDPNAPGGPHG